MAEQLKPMSVNPGDPITSELMANLVSNINIINSMSNSVVTEGDTTTSVQTVIESGRIKVPCNTAGTGSKPVTFTKTFSVRPNIVCTIWQSSANNFLKQKYQPIVTEASTSGFTIRMMPVGATSGGDVWVQWVAVS